MIQVQGVQCIQGVQNVQRVSTGCPNQRLSSLQLVVPDELEEGEGALRVVGGALPGRAPRLRRLVAAEPLVLLLRQVGVAGPAQQEVDRVPQQAVPVSRVGCNLKRVNIFKPSNIFSQQKYLLYLAHGAKQTGPAQTPGHLAHDVLHVPVEAGPDGGAGAGQGAAGGGPLGGDGGGSGDVEREGDRDLHGGVEVGQRHRHVECHIKR